MRERRACISWARLVPLEAALLRVDLLLQEESPDQIDPDSEKAIMELGATFQEAQRILGGNAKRSRHFCGLHRHPNGTLKT